MQRDDKLLIGESVVKSGFILFDNKNIKAYFIEAEDFSQPPSRRMIKQFINNSKTIILLRNGLKNTDKSNYLSLTLCSTDKKFVIDKKKLLYNRYMLIKIDNYLFYRVNRKYSDNKKRYLFCKND